MELEFLGTGNAFTRTKGPSCAILRHKNEFVSYELLIDAGEGVTELVCNEIDKGNLWTKKEAATILLTHMHPDHIAGLGNLIFELRYRYNIKRYNILVGCRYHKDEIESMLKTFGNYDGQHGIHIDLQIWEPVEENPLVWIHERKSIDPENTPNDKMFNWEVTKITLETKHVPHDGAKSCFGVRAIATKYIEDTSKEVSELTSGTKMVSKDVIMYSGDTLRFFGYSTDSIGDDIIMKDVTSIEMYHEASISNSPLHIHISSLLRDINNYDKNFFIGVPKKFVLYHLPDVIEYIDQLRVYGDIDGIDIELAESKKGIK